MRLEYVFADMPNEYWKRTLHAFHIKWRWRATRVPELTPSTRGARLVYSHELAQWAADVCTACARIKAVASKRLRKRQLSARLDVVQNKRKSLYVVIHHR